MEPNKRMRKLLAVFQRSCRSEKKVIFWTRLKFKTLSVLMNLTSSSWYWSPSEIVLYSFLEGETNDVTKLVMAAHQKYGVAMKPNKILTVVLVSAVLGAVWVNSSFSAETPFYRGKTLTVLINFAAGGPTDIEGRLVARFLGRHIPGHPSIVVQNMPGAGGVTGTNYLGEIAKPDGSILGYFTGQFFNLLTADPNLRVDLAKFAYIASIEGVAVAYTRKDVPPGIQEPKDIVKAKNLKAGGLSLNSAKDVRFRLQLDILGIPHQYVTGYNSNSDARLALERNEIQFFTEGTPGYRSQVQPRLVKEGLVTPIYADELVTADGEFRPSAEVPDIPSFSQLHQQIFGKLGSGVLWETLKTINLTHAMQRIAKVAPNTPPEAIAALRQGFLQMIKDPEFIEEFKKVTRSEPAFQVGGEADKLIRRLVQASPEVKTTIRKYTENK
jgi:tripartite-type tricarboxylate transporter receptor subunit TctC